ncbi:MAG TPA: hypothetical protein VF646_08165 [Cytophagales bacterium]|jgi:hypothetical protein
MIQLDDVHSEAGCLQHLLLAEARSPEKSGYNLAEIRVVLQAMKAVIENRQALGKNHIFCSVNAASIIDFICAPVSPGGCQAKQFEGFTKGAGGKVSVADPIRKRIAEAVRIANNTQDPRSAKYVTHIQEIIAVVQNASSDPYTNIPGVIGGESVLKGAYGWKTSGSTQPGGAYVKIPQVVPPLNHPNGDLQGIQFYTIKSVAGFLERQEFELFFMPAG